MAKPLTPTELWDYYHGNNFFKFWIGPKVDNPEKMALIERVFQSANILAECLDNWRDGLIAEPFRWQLKDKNGNRAEAPQAEIELQRWLDWVEQQAIATGSQFSDPWQEFVLSVGVTGEGNLRLWQPERFSSNDDPIKRIHLHSPYAGSVGIQRGLDGFIDWISYSYGTGNLEKQIMSDRGLLQVEDGQSTLNIDTGGRWLIQQVKSPSLLTESVRKLQNSINHGLTMKLRNQEVSGFRERVFLNAQPPGRWERDENGAEIFIPEPMQRGAGTDQFLSGLPNGESYIAPSIHESQPVDMSTLLSSFHSDIELIYRQFRQSYRLQAQSGTLSGESRIQQRQEFELFLRGWKRKIEAAIANILNIVLIILGYKDLEAVVKLQISTGKLTAEEIGAVIAEYQAGLLSKATAIALLGTVQDVDAELALIAEEVKAATTPKPKPPADFADDTLDGGNSSGSKQQNNNGTKQSDPNPTTA